MKPKADPVAGDPQPPPRVADPETELESPQEVGEDDQGE